MKVYGCEVTQGQQDAIVAAMRGRFEMLDIVGAATRAGVGSGHRVNGSDYQATVAGRAVDRLLQRERKAGRIKFKNGRWFALKPE